MAGHKIRAMDIMVWHRQKGDTFVMVASETAPFAEEVC